jgi:N,N'-diacetyllegionaminate synthase
MPLNLNPDRAFIIAEAGTAHKGSLLKAKQLVMAAHKAGADAVKFQWFTEDVYQGNMFCWMEGDEKRSQRWSWSAMTLDEWREVKFLADHYEIHLLASTFQSKTVRWLTELKIPATKVASRAAAKFPYWTSPEPYLISLGMSNGEHVAPAGSIYLECEANYPSATPWRGEYPGFSDHSGKPFLGVDAISRGCRLLEVHFMTDPLDAGPDLPACLTVDELRLVCDARDYYAERKAA